MSATPATADMALLRRAASGDLPAIRELIEYTFGQAVAGNATLLHVVHVAEVFARMAALNGTPQDGYILAQVLFAAAQAEQEAGDDETAARHAVEAIALLSEMADEGHEESARDLLVVADRLPSTALALAKQFCAENAEAAA